MKHLLPELTAELPAPTFATQMTPYTYPIPKEDRDGISQPVGCSLTWDFILTLGMSS